MASLPQQGTKRKRADLEANEVGALQRMYESEQWTDLSIETPTKTFRVHKAVVCEINPFMKAACTRGFVETQTNRIKLPEDEAVIEAILQSFYEVPITLFQFEHPGGKKDEALLQYQASNLIKLSVAADKYDIKTSFRMEIEGAFWSSLYWIKEPYRLVEVGCEVWNQPEQITFDMPMIRSDAKVIIARRLHSIVQHTDAWTLLCRHPELLREILEYNHERAQFGDFQWPCREADR